MRGRVPLAAAAGAIVVCVGMAAPGEAHKPITSPYTFSDDVLPIVKERCGACHAAGGVAPMSLLTHADAVPWGESMRAELMAGHMPPWPVDSAPGRFRNVHPLSGRELNVLLTWASGGTPAGAASAPASPPASAETERRWPLGEPDVVLALPTEAALPPDVQERVDEFTIATAFPEPRLLRAIDLLPGTPAIVRSATVSVKSGGPAASAPGPMAPERLLALWVPGDHPVPLDAGTAIALPAGAELLVRVHYRKTWEYERQAMTDRSSVGLYFADTPASPLQALPLTAATGTMDAASSLAFTTVIGEPLRALAIYPDPALAHVRVAVTATRPDGSREELIDFRPRPGWARRYWFAQPIALPRGTRIEVTARFDEDMLLPPGAIPAPLDRNAANVTLTLNAVVEPAEQTAAR